MALYLASFMTFLLMTLVSVSSAEVFLTATLGKQEIRKYGAFGSSKAQNYSFQLGEGERFTEIYVRHGILVDAIGFLVSKSPIGVINDNLGVINSNLGLQETSYRVQFGGNGGNETKIVLKDCEYPTRIWVRYGLARKHGYFAIGWLTIYTNLRPEGYGPFGTTEEFADWYGTQTPDDPDAAIVGVFGRSDESVESIGILVRKATSGATVSLCQNPQKLLGGNLPDVSIKQHGK